LPLQDYPRYARFSQEITGKSMPELRAYFLELFTERKPALRPGIISSLLEARLGGRPLTEEELLGLCGQLFLGANVEITPFLGNVVQSLIEHPEVAGELRAEPGLIPSAIEEMLRFYPPLPTTGPRRATVDVELGGQRVSEGQRVIPVMASANRDDAVFADPDHFDIRRQPNPHLSFVTGPHICPGAHLSRLEAQIVLAVVLERFAEIWPAPGEVLVPAGRQRSKQFSIIVRPARDLVSPDRETA